MEALVAERPPDFLWYGRPVFRCRFCGRRFERVENLDAVLEHERDAHVQEPGEQRQSHILGTDGNPLLVAEEGREQ